MNKATQKPTYVSGLHACEVCSTPGRCSIPARCSSSPARCSFRIRAWSAAVHTSPTLPLCDALSLFGRAAHCALLRWGRVGPHYSGPLYLQAAGCADLHRKLNSCLQSRLNRWLCESEQLAAPSGVQHLNNCLGQLHDFFFRFLLSLFVNLCKSKCAINAAEELLF